MIKRYATILLVIALPGSLHAAFMDETWAQHACDAWNRNTTLTLELAGDVWVGNNGGRGYKLVQMYRTACGEDSRIQLTLESIDDKAVCTAAGKPDGKAFNKRYDYVMHAKDDHWSCIGAGKFGCGAMGAMSTGKLKFTGPKMEAMGVMGPFGTFLRLTGELGGEKSACE